MGAVNGSAVVVVVLVDRDTEVVVGRVVGLGPDLALVDALARAQLAARRLGCSIRLRDPCEDLCELLDLVGLAPCVAGAPELPLEPGREAEGGEQRGIEEVVEPGDPSA